MYCYTKNAVFNEDCALSVCRHTDNEAFTHTHEFIEIVYIAGGTGYHYIDGMEYKIKRGDLLFINYGKTHSFKSDEDLIFYNILLTPEFLSLDLIKSSNAFDLLALSAFDELNVESGSRPLITFDLNEITEIEGIINFMHKEYSSKQTGYKSALKSYLTVLLIKIFRKMAGFDCSFEKPPLKTNIPPEILEYIKTNYNRKISLFSLSRQCFYNPSYFSRIFKEIYGLTLTQYIHNVRIGKACRLLMDTKFSIDEICTLVGYSDKTIFYKQFKAAHQMTPAAYRRQCKK